MYKLQAKHDKKSTKILPHKNDPLYGIPIMYPLLWYLEPSFVPPLSHRV